MNNDQIISNALDIIPKELAQSVLDEYKGHPELTCVSCMQVAIYRALLKYPVRMEQFVWPEGVCPDHAPWKRCKGCDDIPVKPEHYPSQYRPKEDTCDFVIAGNRCGVQQSKHDDSLHLFTICQPRSEQSNMVTDETVTKAVNAYNRYARKSLCDLDHATMLKLFPEHVTAMRYALQVVAKDKTPADVGLVDAWVDGWLECLYEHDIDHGFTDEVEHQHAAERARKNLGITKS